MNVRYLSTSIFVTAAIFVAFTESADAQRRATRYGSGGSTGSSNQQEFNIVIDGEPITVQESFALNRSVETSFTILEAGIADTFPGDQNIGFFPGAIASYVGTLTTVIGEPRIGTCEISPEFGGGTVSCAETDFNDSVIFDEVPETETLFEYQNLDLLATKVDSVDVFDTEGIQCQLENGLSATFCSFFDVPGVRYEFKSGDEVVATIEVPYPDEFNPTTGEPELQTLEAINDLSFISQNFLNEQQVLLPAIGEIAGLRADSFGSNSFSEEVIIPDSDSQSVPESSLVLSIITAGIASYSLKHKAKKS